MSWPVRCSRSLRRVGEFPSCEHSTIKSAFGSWVAFLAGVPPLIHIYLLTEEKMSLKPFCFFWHTDIFLNLGMICNIIGTNCGKNDGTEER